MRNISFCIALSMILSVPLALAEDLPTIFKKVDEFVAQKNFPKALEELQWAEKEINKMHIARVKTFLPDTLAGLNGKPFKTNTALGMTNVERAYSSGAETVKISLMGGSNSAASGIAGIGRMAALMGQQQGQESFRIEGRTASLMDKSGRSELSVFLESGGILKLEMRDAKQPGGERLKAVANAVKIVELDDYLKGNLKGAS